MELKRVLLVYTQLRCSTINKIRLVLDDYGIKYGNVQRELLKTSHIRNIDLVIAIGGDGTFLKAAQYIKDDTPVMGVNPEPAVKEGFYMKADKDSFERELGAIINDKIHILRLNRLRAAINNKAIPYFALNEFYLGSYKAYGTSRYYLTIRGEREFQKSSGVLVSTPSGSYAWVRASGGRVIPLDSDKFEFYVREPYTYRLSRRYKLLSGILNPDEIVGFESSMKSGVVIADSIGKLHRLRKGDKVAIRISDSPLHAIMSNPLIKA